MYESRESLYKWLEELYSTKNSYHWGSDISAARGMITASGLLPATVEWLKEKQNKENGTWEKEFDTTAVNGVLKICGYFNKDTESFPYYDIYIKNLVEFTKVFSPASAAAAWNPLGSLKVILENLKEEPSPEIKEIIESGIADMITNTTAKMREFRQPDHGFGYGRKGSSPYSNDVEVSLGLPEGDVNALALPVLRHRLKLTFEAVAERVSADDIVNMIVEEMSQRAGIAPEKKAEAEKPETKKSGIFGRK
jgi:hypothetical protein